MAFPILAQASRPAPPDTSPTKRAIGSLLIGAASVAFILVFAVQAGHSLGWLDRGFANWRPVAIAVLVWCVAFDVGIVLTRGAKGAKALFLLPAVQLTLAFVIFPTIFGLYVAFTDWNLSAQGGRQFSGLDNFRRMARDDDFWNALANNFKYLIGVLIQYVIAFGLALLLSQNIRGRKLFRVIFLLPFMLSPVAVGWMIGRSIMDAQYGVIVPLLEDLGFEDVSFYDQGSTAFIGIMAMDAWYSIPFIMVLLLAGLQAIPTEIYEAARIDGSSAWRSFWDMTFPLMLPVSLTAIVLRMIFEFKLVDVVRVVTRGGPGLATDTMTNYIYREGIEQTNIGYATAMSQVFLLIIIVWVAFILVAVGRRVRDVV
jgi:multiple sugar transport system permease protein